MAMRRLLIPIASLAIAASATVAWALNGPAFDDRRPAAATAGLVRHAPLLIDGHVTGMFPGRRTKMRVTVLNRSRRTLVVRRVITDVSPASESCGAENLRVATVRPRLTVRPHRKGRLALPVRMDSGAGDGCQDASFPLSFRASSVPK
jgi:hypothetical protein